MSHQTELLPVSPPDGTGREMVFVDFDDMAIEVFSPNKHGAGLGYYTLRGLNGLTATISTAKAAPLILGQQLARFGVLSVRAAGADYSVTVPQNAAVMNAIADTPADA
ncbi:hypothetical protein [Yaniella flava]|uniref:hypothetical protein n=1 Tax=Yaniella flava TaxID=287930 RepID=UPI003CD0AC81